MAPRVAVPIAPAGPLPPSHAAIQFDSRNARVSSLEGSSIPATVKENDVVILHGTAFNGRGYRVCGVRNKRGALCGRIGTCPFHSSKRSGSEAHIPSTAPSTGFSPEAPNAHTAGTEGLGCGGSSTISPFAFASPDPAAIAPHMKGYVGYPLATRRLPAAPERSRFKRSWTKEEHSRFLVALGRFGRGKWKEIAAFVGTRNGSQCQSHACKYFKRQAKGEEERKKASIHDMTEPVPILESSPARAASAVGRCNAGRRPASNEAAALVARPQAPSSVGPVCTVERGRDFGASEVAVGHVPHEDAQLLLAGREVIDVPKVHEGCVSACSPEPRICVFVHLNGCKDNSRKVHLPESMEMQEFLASAAAQLDVAATLTRIFTRSGTEIESLDSIMDLEELWLSTGEDFRYDVGSSHETQMAEPAENVDAEENEEGNHVRPDSNDGLVEMEVDELGVEERIPVVVYLNRTVSGSIDTVLPDSMCMDEFLASLAVKFGITETLSRLFTRSGAEIESLDEICDGEHLWASSGEDFSCGA